VADVGVFLEFRLDNIVETDTGLTISVCSKLTFFFFELEFDDLAMVNNVQVGICVRVGCGIVESLCAICFIDLLAK
jgi:hypothetical protein